MSYKPHAFGRYEPTVAVPPSVSTPGLPEDPPLYQYRPTSPKSGRVRASRDIDTHVVSQRCNNPVAHRHRAGHVAALRCLDSVQSARAGSAENVPRAGRMRRPLDPVVVVCSVCQRVERQTARAVERLDGDLIGRGRCSRQHTCQHNTCKASQGCHVALPSSSRPHPECDTSSPLLSVRVGQRS